MGWNDPSAKEVKKGGRIYWAVKCPGKSCGQQECTGSDKKAALRAWRDHDKAKHKPEREGAKRSEANKKAQEKKLNRKLARELTTQEMRIEVAKQKEELRKREEDIEEGSRTGKGNKDIHNQLYIPKGYKVNGVSVKPGQNVNGLVYDEKGHRVTRKMMGLDD